MGLRNQRGVFSLKIIFPQEGFVRVPDFFSAYIDEIRVIRTEQLKVGFIQIFLLGAGVAVGLFFLLKNSFFKRFDSFLGTDVLEITSE